MEPKELDHLFSNASEFSCWTSKNCDKCKKYQLRDDMGFSACEIENSIFDVACGGSMPVEVATRMGYDGKFGWQWRNQCREFEVIN